MTAYCTLQEIRDRGITVEAAPDEAVERAIARATRMVDVFTGRDFLKREATYLLDGTGTELIFLDDRPVIEVLELRVNGHGLLPRDFVVYPDAGIVRLNGARRDIFSGFPGVFPKGAQNLTVRGLFGFETVPPEVNEACIRLAIEILRAASEEANVSGGSSLTTRKAIGIRHVRIDDIAVDFEYPSSVKEGGRLLTTGLPEADGLLARWRRDLHAMAI
jgi:hypothetical protein